MSNYTSDSDNIYFLNDKNIASGVDNECPAGFNAVPSQSAFVEKYKELSARDKELSDYIQNNIETSCASISSKLTAFEVAVATDYLKTTGGEISGSLSIQKTLSVGETLVVEGQVSSKYVQTSDDGSITFTAPDKHGKIVFDFEHGVKDIIVNGEGETLCSFIQNETESAANAAQTAAEKHSDDNYSAAKKYADDQIDSRICSLDYVRASASTGKMIDSISQTDGVISATIREITSADIPVLPDAKIENLVAKYATKSDVANEYVKAETLEFYYNKNNDNCIWLVDKDHNVRLSVDCAGFVKDGMISSVKILDDGDGYSKENGPYLVITWNADAGVDQTWIKIRDFFKVCVSTDENGGLSVNDYKIWLNYDVVAKTADVKPIKDYVDSLSAPAVGAIDVLSSGISALNVQNVRQVKFDGHIEHAKKSLKEIIKANSDTAVEDLVRNNSIFDVMFTDAELSAPSASYTTNDGFTLGNGDIVVIHDCDAKQESVGIDDLNEDNVKVLKGGVARYEFEAEKKTRSDCDALLSGFVDQVLSGAAKLSGGNEISGDNWFVNGTLGISSAIISGMISVDFGKLIDNASTSSAVEICAYLSTAISNHINDRGNPHHVSAGQISAYLCSETSSATELDEKFGSLSANLTCDASCTVTKLVQNDGVISAQFTEISIDQAHVSGLTADMQFLSDEIRNKVRIGKYDDSELSPANLSIMQIADEKYYDLILADKIDPSVLYIVSSDVLNAYGQRVTEVADAEQDSDAVNRRYMASEIRSQIEMLSAEGLTCATSSTITEITQKNGIIGAKFEAISIDIDHVASLGDKITAYDKLSTYAETQAQLSNDGYATESYVESAIIDLSVESLTCATSCVMTKMTETSGKVSAEFEPISISANQVVGLSGKIEAYDKLSSYDEIHSSLSGDGYATNEKVSSSDTYLSGKIDGKIQIGEYNDKKYNLVSADSLSVVKIANEDYYNLVLADEIELSALYVVSSDVVNAYDQRVVNVASPISATDAVNLRYMESTTAEMFAKSFAEALKKAESLNAYLTSDNAVTLIDNGFTNMHVLSILLDIKKIFAELSSATAG